MKMNPKAEVLNIGKKDSFHSKHGPMAGFKMCAICAWCKKGITYFYPEFYGWIYDKKRGSLWFCSQEHKDKYEKDKK